MAETNSAEALLNAALQDMRAANDLLIAHLPRICAHVSDRELRGCFDRLLLVTGEHREALMAIGGSEGGPQCLWMKGVVDDADRDAATVAPGPLLDTALIGAIRKGLVAIAAAHETAIALARPLGLTTLAQSLSALRQSIIDADAKLVALLPGRAARQEGRPSAISA